MKGGQYKIRISILLLFSISLFILPKICLGQKNISELSLLLNNLSFNMPDGLGDSLNTEYAFVHAGCFCSISQATTGKKDRMNSISTYSFNLSEIKEGKILLNKPRDSNFREISQDIWRIEIGVFDILVQNTNWQSQQTKTNHFYFNVTSTALRDRIIDLLKKSVEDCGGHISEVSVLSN